MDEPRQKIYDTIFNSYVRGTLPQRDWTAYQLVDGIFIAHIDFLQIQDDFNEIENVHDVWSSSKCIDAVTQYLDVYSKYRKRHIELFEKALEQLKPIYRSKIYKIMDKLNNKETLCSINASLFGLPWRDDNTLLWDSFLQINPEELSNFKPWAKIIENGLIFSSRVHRNDDPEGHDYFAWAFRTSSNITDTFTRTAQHEGSHSITDEIIRYSLNLDFASPICEGLAGYLGNDQREKHNCNMSIVDFLLFDWINNKDLEHMGTQIASTKFFYALRAVINRRTNTNSDLLLFCYILRTICELDKSVMALSIKKRYRTFFETLIKVAEIDIQSLSKLYDECGKAV